MKSNLIVGIDPGKAGGIAWKFHGGLVACVPMPLVEQEIVSQLQELFDGADGNCLAYIEKVSGYWVGAPSTVGFAFGKNVGIIMGALYSIGFRIVEVSPVTWQKSLGLRGIDVKKRKNAFKNRAHQLFPELKRGITLKTADALLIFEYACRLEKLRAF